MPKICGDRFAAVGRDKSIAYAVGENGERERLTRQRLLSGQLPAWATQVVIAPVGHTSTHALYTEPGLLRLTPGEAAALARGYRGRPGRIDSVMPQPHTVQLTAVGVGSDGEPAEVEVDASFSIYELDGRKVTFGVLPGVTADSHAELAGVELLPRNPYVLSGTVPGTPEGDEAALRYTAALVALHEAQPCQDCGHTQSCALCLGRLAEGHDVDRRPVAHLLTAASLDNTVVDALTLKAAAGDLHAAAELKALAVAGESLIRRAARTSEMLQPDTIDRVLNYDDATFRTWYDTQRQQLSADYDRLQDDVSAAYREVSQLVGSGEPERAIEAQARRDQLARERTVAERRLSDLESLRVARTFGTAAADGDGLVLVHETSFDLERDDDGNVLLRPRGDREDDGVRDTVHMTLNHGVAGHVGRAGTGARYAVLVDVPRLLRENPGALACLSPIDMQLCPPPRQPLRLPAEAVQVVEYSSDDSEERAAQVHAALRERGAVVFPGGAHYSSPAAEDLTTVFAARHGVTTGLHHSSGAGTTEASLIGVPNSHLSYLPSLPSLSAWEARGLGTNGRLRLFDRGGEGESGRSVGRAWSGMVATAPRRDDDLYNF
jgi:hypothetical protein